MTRKEKNLIEWRQYLVARGMRDDDRSQQYIAKKLGYNSASSVQNILNRFDGLEELIEEHVEKAVDNAMWHERIGSA